MIRCGRFTASIIAGGYQINDDVHGLVRTVYLPHASRSALKRQASAEVAQLDYQLRAEIGAMAS